MKISNRVTHDLQIALSLLLGSDYHQGVHDSNFKPFKLVFTTKICNGTEADEEEAFSGFLFGTRSASGMMFSNLCIFPLLLHLFCDPECVVNGTNLLIP